MKSAAENEFSEPDLVAVSFIVPDVFTRRDSSTIGFLQDWDDVFNILSEIPLSVVLKTLF